MSLRHYLPQQMVLELIVQLGKCSLVEVELGKLPCQLQPWLNEGFTGCVGDSYGCARKAFIFAPSIV